MGSLTKDEFHILPFLAKILLASLLLLVSQQGLYRFSAWSHAKTWDLEHSTTSSAKTFSEAEELEQNEWPIIWSGQALSPPSSIAFILLIATFISPSIQRIYCCLFFDLPPPRFL